MLIIDVHKRNEIIPYKIFGTVPGTWVSLVNGR